MAVKSSSRPNHIKTEVNSSEPEFIEAQVSVGPYAPKAGPVLPNPDAATERMVSNDASGIIMAKTMH